MNSDQTIRALLAGAGQAADEAKRAEARRDARIAWVKETMAALRAVREALCPPLAM